MRSALHRYVQVEPTPTSTRLLAFVYGYLGEHDLLRVRTDSETYLVLATLNLVECVASVGSTNTPS
jgi:hypothetical protein